MKKQIGFTLIELLIVIAIIGILAAIAYPSYQGAIMDSRRTTAEGDLVSLANFMERYYTTNSSYTGATLPYTQSPKDGSSKFYNLSIATAASGAQFTLTATPIGSQAGERCGNLTFNYAGSKTPANNKCW